jgi:CHASE2 domain-containing sensor protein
MTWKMALSAMEYLIMFAVLFFACYLSWSSKRSPLHLLWLIPAVSAVLILALGLFQ